MASWKDNLMHRFGLTPADYHKMLEDQGGTCWVCMKPPTPKRRLSVDHCHETNKVRGLLCTRCNMALGYFEDNPYRLERALRYLKK